MAGSVIARQLAESGRDVLVVEKHRHVAGHCYDYRNEHGITVHAYGPHIFHTKNKETWNFVNRFVTFRPYHHRVQSYAHGRLVPFPISCDTLNELFNLNLSVQGVEEFLKDEVNRSSFDDPPKNFRDQVVSQVGERLYETFFENYTRKQWERDPRELSADIAKRIPVRMNRDNRYFDDQFQGIPTAGYTGLVEAILDHPKIALLTGADYFDLRQELSARTTVFTGELDRYFDYRFGKLEYRSLRLDFVTMDTPKYQDVAVVNYPNDYEWTRITEFKHLSGERSDKTTILFEYPSAEGEPYYVVYSEDNLARRKKYLEVAAMEKKEQNVFFLGRLAEYKYYNMDQVIEAAIQLSGEIS